ncbi:MAG: hypothetical protein KC652_25755 [Cyanobacteria bacterium HKST-UBA01]|nr:hypothetical protein [Cyanobacteria bacterium HKST-UBA01]
MSFGEIVAPGCAAHADTKSGESTPARRAAFQEGLYCTNAVPEKIQCPAIIEKDVAVMRVFVPFQQKINTAMGMPSSDCKYEKICWSVLADLGKLPPSASRTAAIESTLDFLNKHLSSSSGSDSPAPNESSVARSSANIAEQSSKGGLDERGESIDGVKCFSEYIDALAADNAGSGEAAEKLYSSAMKDADRMCRLSLRNCGKYQAVSEYALSEISAGYGDFLTRSHASTKLSGSKQSAFLFEGWNQNLYRTNSRSLLPPGFRRTPAVTRTPRMDLYELLSPPRVKASPWPIEGFGSIKRRMELMDGTDCSIHNASHYY